MRASILTKKGFAIRELPKPDPKPNELLVKTIACGVCEGDMVKYRTVTQGDSNEEMLLGHEGSGVVETIGSRVKKFKEGDTVACLNGCYAEYFVSKPEQATRVPESIKPELALGEPIACCVHAAQRFGIRLGDRVLMIGCGFMGLVCLQLAKLQGASKIVALDLMDWRLDQARKYGADVTTHASDLKLKENLNDLGEFDVIVEATGAQEAIDMATDLVKEHGRIMVVGYHQSNHGLRTVNMKKWNWKAIDVVNGHVRRNQEKHEAMQQGLALMGAGKLHVADIVQNYPLARINRAFQDLANRKPGLYKPNLIMTCG